MYAQTEQQLSFREAFATAMLNFSHFTSTETTGLRGECRTDLLHDLMRQCAALQLVFAEPVWNLLIPIYFGDPKTAFDVEKLSVVLISVKNKSTHLTSGDLCYF